MRHRAHAVGAAEIAGRRGGGVADEALAFDLRRARSDPTEAA